MENYLRIVVAFLKYDYGIKERGYSGEEQIWLPALTKVADEVVPFWLEENGFPNNNSLLQKNLINFVEEIKPDIVFFMLMNDEITLDTLDILKQKTTTINWFWDDHWRFESFTKYVAPKLTYSITVDKYSLQKYKNIGCENVILSQGAVFEYVEFIEKNIINYKYDISFVGGKNSTREWIIEELRKSGYSVECFGSGWKNGKVSFDEMKNIFIETKINLNISNSLPYDIRFYNFLKQNNKNQNLKIDIREPIKTLKSIKSKLFPGVKYYTPKNREQIKARNFEIPGCGGFQLTNYVLSLEDYYDIGKEIIVYANIDDLKSQLEYYLIHEEEREQIKKAGHARSRNYTYEDRLKSIISDIYFKKNISRRI